MRWDENRKNESRLKGRIVIFIIPQDKSYLRMLVMKLSPRSLQFILTSDRLSARLLALPEGVTLHLFSFSQLVIGSIIIAVLPFSLLSFFLFSSHLISFHFILHLFSQYFSPFQEFLISSTQKSIHRFDFPILPLKLNQISYFQFFFRHRIIPTMAMARSYTE